MDILTLEAESISAQRSSRSSMVSANLKHHGGEPRAVQRHPSVHYCGNVCTGLFLID